LYDVDAVRSQASLAIAVAALAGALAFVLYALSGADLCLWCRALGR
jgi:hypothetical protein